MFECTAIQHFKVLCLETNSEITDASKLTKVKDCTAITVLLTGYLLGKNKMCITFLQMFR